MTAQDVPYLIGDIYAIWTSEVGVQINKNLKEILK